MQITIRCFVARAIGVAAFAFLILFSSHAEAASFLVNTTMDLADPDLFDGRCEIPRPDGSVVCSLRAAIQQANVIHGEQHTISVPSGTYSLLIPGSGEDFAASGDLDINRDIEIIGSGVPAAYCLESRTPFIPPDLPMPGGCRLSAVPEGTVIDGAGLDRVFQVRSGTVRIRDLAIINGVALPPSGMERDGLGDGGGIFNGGYLTLIAVALANNRASGGGGIHNVGLLLVDGSNISFNHSTSDDGCGGGIANNDRIVITSSYIAANDAVARGGGICSSRPEPVSFDEQVSFSVWGSTIAGNRASFGGGVHIHPKSHSPFADVLAGTTVIGNIAFDSGGGIYAAARSAEGGGLAIVDSFVVFNQAVGDRRHPHREGGDAGGVFSLSPIHMRRTAIRQNIAVNGSGGGVLMRGTADDPIDLSASRTEIALNQARLDGAGLHTEHATLGLANVTLSGNAARGAGGAVRATDSRVLLDRVTVVGNRVGNGGAGLDLQRGSYQAGLTIIAGNDSRNCRLRSVDDAVGDPAASPFARGFSIEDRDQCRFDAVGDRVRLDPMVEPALQNNGGPTWTHALQDGSPALDAVEPIAADPVLVACQPDEIDQAGLPRTVDQRGVLRPRNVRCDAGAFERADDAPFWLTHCCFDLWLDASGAMSSAEETSAEFRLLMVREQLQDGILLAAQILKATDSVLKALKMFRAAQSPDGARHVLELAQPQFAAIEQHLAALEACCGGTLDRDGGRLRMKAAVARAYTAFLELKAAVQPSNPGDQIPVR